MDLEWEKEETRDNFTLLGGVDEPPPIQGEFYALSRDWMTPCG